MNYLKVEGKEGLVRDPSTKAIINVNVDEYQKHMAARKAKADSMKRIDKLEADLADIKSMLQQLINKA